MSRVVTYRRAYDTRTISLCEYHAAVPPSRLSTVEHGAHDGDCDECGSVERDDAMGALLLRMKERSSEAGGTGA